MLFEVHPHPDVPGGGGNVEANDGPSDTPLPGVEADHVSSLNVRGASTV